MAPATSGRALTPGYTAGTGGGHTGTMWFTCTKEIAMRMDRSGWAHVALVAVAALLLTGCGAAPHNPDTAGAATGVTVYGTVDAGIGRSR